MIDINAQDKLRKDLALMAAKMSRKEARLIIDLYYQIQEYRKAAKSQVRSIGPEEKPAALLQYISDVMEDLESTIQKWMEIYTDKEPSGMGAWLRKIVGIGPILSAGLLAHIDIGVVQVAGAIWRFAGLDPSLKWLGKEKADALVTEVVGKSRHATIEQITEIAMRAKRRPENILLALKEDIKDGQVLKTKVSKLFAKRPWNGHLKTLCWKIGESFKNTCNNEKSYYGKIYSERKVFETMKNERLDYASQAQHILTVKRIDKKTEAYKAYIQDKLPPAHILERSKRYAVKLFLAHFFEESYRRHYKKEPPRPYAIEHLGHTHIRPAA